jgi:diacylglycerol kinase (ATP)
MKTKRRMRTKRAMLIINPMAGLGKRKQTRGASRAEVAGAVGGHKEPAEEVIEAVAEECARARMKLDVEFTKYPQHGMEIAKRARGRYDLVIAAGGDGTINEVINGIANSRTILAIIPIGTVNVLALELGIPLNVKEASRLIMDGQTVAIDLGYAETMDESRYFSLALGVGLDALVMKDTTLELRRKWGGLGYLMTGTKQLMTYKWPRISINHSVTSTGYFVIVANSKHVWGDHQLADDASMTDGLLDLVVINRKVLSAVDLLLTFSKGRLNRYLRKECYQVRRVEITAESEVVVQADGEIIGRAPLKVSVVPKALRVIANNGIQIEGLDSRENRQEGSVPIPALEA